MVNADALLHRARDIGLPAYGDDEVRFLAGVLDRFRPTHVFDWGTNVGASARLFYEAAIVIGYQCDVHTFELPPDEAWRDRDHPGHRYAQQLIGIPVTLHLGDGLELAIKLCVHFQPQRPLFFLDGCHEHDVVLNELDTIAYEEPGAVMVVHDTMNLTGTAVNAFLDHSSSYRREEVRSDAGMVALWPSL